MLAKLGISVERKYITAMMRELDKNANGMLDFEEFTTMILYDPYKWDPSSRPTHILPFSLYLS